MNGLTCYCDGGDYDWYYRSPDDYATLDTKRARKCCSCKSHIKVGDLCVKFVRYEMCNEDSISYRIHGNERSLAPYFMCEACGDQYFNLEALGFCMSIGSDNMQDLRKEYVKLYGPRNEIKKQTIA